jgi:hypothetical protein
MPHFDQRVGGGEGSVGGTFEGIVSKRRASAATRATTAAASTV